MRFAQKRVIHKKGVRFCAIAVLLFAMFVAILRLSGVFAFAAETPAGSGAEDAFYGESITEYGGEELLNEIMTENFLSYYFINLNCNIPDNPDNLCSYVATGMALAFYDSWWNDDLISDKDVIKTELIEENAINFFINVESPGARYDYVYKLKGNLPGNEEAFYVVEGILENVGLSSWFQIDTIAEGEVQFTIDMIDAGHPVILDVKPGGTGQGHVTIAFAYDYDEEGNALIYLHDGYPGTPNARITVFEEDDEYMIHSASAIIPNENNPHICSDNYYYTNADGSVTYHCPCELEEHPAHAQKYPHTYTAQGAAHAVVCPANGTVATEAHDFATVLSFDGAAHTKACACGSTVIEEHTLSYAGSFSDWQADPLHSTHTVSCPCGFSEERPHEIQANSWNGGWHCVCCPCFGEENEPHYPYYEEVYIGGRWYTQCMICGYIDETVLPDL